MSYVVKEHNHVCVEMCRRVSREGKCNHVIAGGCGHAAENRLPNDNDSPEAPNDGTLDWTVDYAGLEYGLL